MKIGIIGVGALGATLAKTSSKLVPDELLLVDKDTLEPGNLIRHESISAHVGLAKVESTALLNRPFIGSSKIRTLYGNLHDKWESLRKDLSSFHLIMDMTAEITVHEQLLQSLELTRAAIVVGYVKPGPDFGFLFLRRPRSFRTLEDARCQIEAKTPGEIWARFVADDAPSEQLVWPQPGCYHPTFRAPFHRMRLMADTYMSTIMAWLQTGMHQDVVTLFMQSNSEGTLGLETRIVSQCRF